MASVLAPALNKDPGRAQVILLADTHPLFRAGMRYMLQEAFGPAEVVEVGSRSDLLTLLESGSFDLVLTSLFSAEGAWEQFFTQLLEHAPIGRLVILSSLDEPTLICRILAAGAAGFLLKETPPIITLDAIRLVLDGGIYVPPAVLSVLSDSSPLCPSGRDLPDVATSAKVPLTERQQSVLRLLVQGASNKVIARSLGLSAGTVKGHVASLLRLFGAENRMELVGLAIRRGGLPAEELGGSEPRRPT